MILIHFHKHTILQQTILLVASLNHDSTVEAAHLLHLSHNEITLNEMLPHMKLVLFNFTPLNTSRQINSRQI